MPPPCGALTLSAWAAPAPAGAARLFAALREFDARQVDVILAEGYSTDGVGLALMNRLEKAAGHRVIEVG